MIEIRPALTNADRLAVTAVAHAAMHPEQPVEYFQALRLAHPRRALATWWLLEDEGKPVCSLVCHPLSLSAGGRVLAGYGLGAVATRPDARKRGHADALCRHAIAEAEAEGRSVGLLYSAIAPAYYARMGFQVLPGWNPVCDDPQALLGSGPTTALVPLDPRRECARLAVLYERHHGNALHMHRDADGFARSITLNPDDLFFGIGEPLRGYVRVCLDETWLDVAELIVPDEDRAPTLRALAGLAVRLPRPKLEGWFDPLPELAAHFRDTGRAKTLPMVRGVKAESSARFWSSDYF